MRESSKLDKLINDYNFRKKKKSLDWYTNDEKKIIWNNKTLFQIYSRAYKEMTCTCVLIQMILLISHN